MTGQEQGLAHTTVVNPITNTHQARSRKAAAPTGSSKTGLGLTLALLGGVASLATLAGTSNNREDTSSDEEVEPKEVEVVTPQVVFEEPKEEAFLSVDTTGGPAGQPYYMSEDEWLDFLERGISQEQIERWDREYPDQDVKAYVLPLVPPTKEAHYFKGPAFINVKKAERTIRDDNEHLYEPVYFRLADTIICISKHRKSHRLYIHHPFESQIPGEGYFYTPEELANILGAFEYSIPEHNIATARCVFAALPEGYLPRQTTTISIPKSIDLVDPKYLPTGAIIISEDNPVASDPIYVRFTNQHGTERIVCISVGRGVNYRQGLYVYDILSAEDRPQGWWKTSEELTELLECSEEVTAGVIDLLPEKHTINRVINLITNTLTRTN